MADRSHTPGTNGWFNAVERRINSIEEDLNYLMHPETGVHARITMIHASLRTWAITILTALLLNLVGVIVAVTVISRKS